MFELPEFATLARQMNDTLKGKTIRSGRPCIEPSWTPSARSSRRAAGTTSSISTETGDHTPASWTGTRLPGHAPNAGAR